MPVSAVTTRLKNSCLILNCAEEMNPSKDAVAYWTNLNRTMLKFDAKMSRFWEVEKCANIEAVEIAKEEALTFLESERTKILRKTHDEAITQLIRNRNLDGKYKVITSVGDNGILAIS